MRWRSAPASLIMSAPRSATTAIPRRSPGCCAGWMTGGPEPTASGPCSPAVYPRPHSSPHSPARRCPATSRAASGPMPGSRQRQARSRGLRKNSTGSSAPHLKHWQPRQWCCASSSLPPDAAHPDPYGHSYGQAGRRSVLVTSIHPAAATAVRIPAPSARHARERPPGVGKTTVPPTRARSGARVNVRTRLHERPGHSRSRAGDFRFRGVMKPSALRSLLVRTRVRGGARWPGLSCVLLLGRKGSWRVAAAGQQPLPVTGLAGAAVRLRCPGRRGAGAACGRLAAGCRRRRCPRPG